MVSVEPREYARLLGYPWGTELEGDVLERADQAVHWYKMHGNPRVHGAVFSPPSEGGGSRADQQILRYLKLGASGGGTLTSATTPAAPQFKGATYPLMQRTTPSFERRGESVQPAITIAAITAGWEVDAQVDKLWNEDRVDEAYFLDRYAAAVVEKLARDLGPYRSPGTGGIPFELQRSLFSYIAPLRPNIEILSSGMLRPKNSILAIVAHDELRDANSCHSCDLAGCTFRRRSA